MLHEDLRKQSTSVYQCILNFADNKDLFGLGRTQFEMKVIKPAVGLWGTLGDNNQKMVRAFTEAYVKEPSHGDGFK
jgi:hypothetical protein